MLVQPVLCVQNAASLKLYVVPSQGRTQLSTLVQIVTLLVLTK